MTTKKFKIITILSNLAVIVVFAWLLITDPFESTSGVLLIFIVLSMSNLYLILKDDDFKESRLCFWRKRK